MGVSLAIGILGFGLLWGYFGYRRAARFEAAYGSNIGGASPAIWAFICFLFGLFGFIVLVLAQKSAMKRVPRTVVTRSSRESTFENNQTWTPPGVRQSQTQDASPYYTPLPNAAPAPTARPNVGGQEFLPRR
jgi:hypothetical protein